LKTNIPVYRDGAPFGPNNGRVSIGADQLYPIIAGEEYGEHLIEIRSAEPGLRAFSFTFG